MLKHFASTLIAELPSHFGRNSDRHCDLREYHINIFLGIGRALGVGEVKFTGQILPTNKKVTYKITLKRVIKRKLFMEMVMVKC